MSRSDTLLLLDFDGTVAVGDGPVRAYAQAAVALLPAADRKAVLRQLDAGLAAVDQDRAPLDGYDLVRMLAEEHGVGPHALSAAYLASRHALATDQAPISAPPGLAELLAELRPDATIVLATNAPDIRLREALRGIGLGGLIDRIAPEVGKPGGMDTLLDSLRVAPAGPVRVLSVGDVWVNDLAPVAARGHTTALISRCPPPEARPTHVGPDLPSLFPAIRTWVQSSLVEGLTR
ncbi:HAD family hydrolase [Cellulomonas taurus]|uniref:HAD family hydrolase n=1 Tax=Cellulomonas taurus TaxID=2729175 RepID=UPI00145F38DD|nr:HAD family hydrolase [Cellulomonas taurus]